MSGDFVEVEINGHVFEVRKIEDLFVSFEVFSKLLVVIPPLISPIIKMQPLFAEGASNDTSSMINAFSEFAGTFADSFNKLSRDDRKFCLMTALQHTYVKTASAYKPVSDGVQILHPDKVDLYAAGKLMFLSFKLNFMEMIKKNLPSLPAQLSAQSGQLNS